MSQSVPAVNSADIGFVSGMLGAGVGYILAPKKYNLEDLLTLKPDVFERALRTDYVKKDYQNKAYNTISVCRKKLVQAYDKGVGDVRLAEFVKLPKLVNAYEDIRPLIPRLRSQSAIVTGILSAFMAVTVKLIGEAKS